MLHFVDATLQSAGRRVRGMSLKGIGAKTRPRSLYPSLARSYSSLSPKCKDRQERQLGWASIETELGALLRTITHPLSLLRTTVWMQWPYSSRQKPITPS
ncbi:hypothetical protein V2G26_008376 [Clonostachys chloroleuca]